MPQTSRVSTCRACALLRSLNLANSLRRGAFGSGRGLVVNPDAVHFTVADSLGQLLGRHSHDCLTLRLWNASGDHDGFDRSQNCLAPATSRRLLPDRIGGRAGWLAGRSLEPVELPCFLRFADELVPLLQSKGVGVMNAGPFSARLLTNAP